MGTERLAIAALLAALACSYTADALLARITCHCTSGDVPGVCLTASHVPFGSKPTARPTAEDSQCNTLCATKEQVLQRCQNAAAMHVGQANCTGFTFDGCAYSCSEDCGGGCELTRDRICNGMRLGL